MAIPTALQRLGGLPSKVASRGARRPRFPATLIASLKPRVIACVQGLCTGRPAPRQRWSAQQPPSYPSAEPRHSCKVPPSAVAGLKLSQPRSVGRGSSHYRVDRLTRRCSGRRYAGCCAAVSASSLNSISLGRSSEVSATAPAAAGHRRGAKAAGARLLETPHQEVLACHNMVLITAWESPAVLDAH